MLEVLQSLIHHSPQAFIRPWEPLPTPVHPEKRPLILSWLAHDTQLATQIATDLNLMVLTIDACIEKCVTLAEKHSGGSTNHAKGTAASTTVPRDKSALTLLEVHS